MSVRTGVPRGVGATRPTGTAVVDRAGPLATTALDTVGRDPRAALELADRAVAAAAATQPRDPSATTTAHRAAALALRELGDLPAAERRARAAVRAAARADPTTASEARMTLAFVLLESGRARAALHQADLAAVGCSGLAAARVASQRALILQRTGRLDEALAGYAAALPVFRRHRDSLWEARLLNNRGRLHTDQGHLARATADLSASRALLLQTGQLSLASDAEWNLALVATLLGDVPLALRRFDNVRSEHVERGTPNPQLQIDRAETLLAVGLVAEALAEAEAAVNALTSAHQDADLPHAMLVVAQARAATGDHRAAARDAGRALTLFRRQHRPTWAAQAGLTALRASEVAGDDATAVLATALRLADEVGRAGWPPAELDARLIAARAAGRCGDEDLRRRQLALAAAHRTLGTVDARLRGWYAEALLRAAAGDRRGTQAALAAGMRVLDQQQDLLGATELRANVSAVGADLVCTGLELALTAGRAREVLRWADRGRARATRPRPVRPPQDPDLIQALADVRRLHAETVEAQLDGSTPPSLADRRRAEREVVAASRRTAGSRHRSTDPTASRELLRALGSRVLIECVEHAGRVQLVVVADGRYRLWPAGAVDQIEAAAAQVRFGVRRLAGGFGTARSRAATHAALSSAAAALEGLVLGGVTERYPDREVVLVPGSSLHGVPWSLLPGLWRRPFVVAPSAAAWLRATTDPGPGPGGPPVLVAGPGLPAALAEIAALAEATTDATVLRHPDAASAPVLAALDGAGWAHIAAHGALRTDNPLFSALLLSDGPLTIYDLEGLRTAPQLIVLSSCESGVASPRPGDELLGLVAALLSLGTRTVVATSLPTPDEATRDVMLKLHARLRGGEDPAAALCGVRAAVEGDDLLAVATAAGFVCYGA